MSKTAIKTIKSATDGSLASLPPAFLAPKVKEVIPQANPYQPFLDKFFPDGNFTKEQMEALCTDLMEVKLQFQPYCEQIAEASCRPQAQISRRCQSA